MARNRGNRRGRANRRGGGGSSASKLGMYIVIFGIFLGFFALNMFEPPELSTKTFCPMENGISKNTYAILLDTTQEISATQKNEITNFIKKLRDNAEVYDRFTIYQVDPSQNKLLSSDFDLCIPADSKLEYPAVVRYKNKAFEAMLEKKLAPDYGRNSSPIIRAIGSVKTQFPDDGSKRHLIIASDLIENSELLSQINSRWKIQAEQNSKVLIDTKPNLTDINLTVLWIPRPYVPHHNDDFILWWGSYFKSAKADIAEIIKIKG
jgi:hypothetical protein